MSDPVKRQNNEKSYILDTHKAVLQQQPSTDSLSQNVSGGDTDQLFETDKCQQTGLSFASVNYINSIVGSGVIGIPFAFQQAGFGLGMVLLAVVAYVTDYSLRLMVRSAHLSGRFSYSGIMAAAFGTPGFYLLSALQFMYRVCAGIPFAFQQAGFGLGMVLLAVVAYVTDYSLRLMVRSAHLSGRFSYSGIMAAAFGTPGFYLLSVLQFMYPFIAMVSYNVVVGDTVTKVLVRMFGLSSSALLARRDVVVFLCTFTVTLPLCLQKDMARLARASLLSLFFVVFILVTITIRLFTLFHVVPPTRDAFEFYNFGVIPAIGIMAFAFMCHHNVFLLYSSIEQASQERWDKVTHYSVFVSFLVTASFGVVGYTTFTGYIQGDMLENYCWEDDLMSVARVVFSVTILLTFPIECLVTRAVVEACWGRLESTLSHCLVTLALVLAAYVVSVSTDCLGLVLELNGVLAAVPLAFVLPAATYLRLWPGSVFSRDKLPALALAVFGLLVAMMGLFTVLTRFSEVDRCSHGRVMPYCNA